MRSRTRVMAAGVVAAALVTLGFVYAMRVSSSDCRAACERPFELSASTAATHRAAWEGFPEPNRAQALAVHQQHAQALETAKQAYLETCVADCRAGATAQQVGCYTRAQNFADWKRCAAP